MNKAKAETAINNPSASVDHTLQDHYLRTERSAKNISLPRQASAITIKRGKKRHKSRRLNNPNRSTITIKDSDKLTTLMNKESNQSMVMVPLTRQSSEDKKPESVIGKQLVVHQQHTEYGGPPETNFLSPTT